MKKLTVFVLVFDIFYLCHSARILGIIPTASYSHQVVYQPLWKELSLRGHQVTVLTTDPINDPSLTNLTEIDTSFTYEIFKKAIPEILNNTVNPIEYLKLNVKLFLNAVEKQLEHPPVKKLLDDPNVGFDLLISEFLVDVPLALSIKYKCPYIGVLSVDAPNYLQKVMGNFIHPVLYPEFLVGEDRDLSFTKRVVAVIVELTFDFILKWMSTSRQKEMIERQFGLNYDLTEHRKNVSLLFINCEPIFHGIRPLNPNTIPIGGKLIRLPLKPLPKDLQTILDNATDGFIYYSLGSNVMNKDISDKTMGAILETFKELPYLVLWKYEKESLPNKPDNVIISKWLPQRDLLKHPNLKLFITHCGAQSKEEGISARVPMLGIPIFGDQLYNVNKLVTRGCALSIDHKTLEKDHFKETILELIRNPSYRNRIRELADLSEDQPMTGLERAVWWTEYVLRHKGAKHLKSPVFDIPWYQYYLLDVALVLLSVFLVIVYVFIVILRTVRKIFRYLIRSNKKFEQQMEHPRVKKLLDDPNVGFDLLISEYILDVPLALSIKYNCPYIAVLTIDSLVIVLSAGFLCQSARILGVIPTASFSHQVVFQPLWKELSLRGHQVTVLTTNPINDPTLTNLTEIDLGFSYKFFSDSLPEIVNNSRHLIHYIDLTLKLFLNSIENQLEHPPVKQLINDPNVRFDLLIVENFLDVPLAFSKKFNCPYIGVLSGEPPNIMHKYMGNPSHPIAYPDLVLGHDRDLTLIQRIIAVLYDYLIEFVGEYLFDYMSYQEKLIQKHFGLKYDLFEYRRNYSLVFTNSEPVFHSVRPLTPTTIPIGGKLMRLASKPLPKDLKNILDEATDGFIYFSLGSNVNSKDLPKEIMTEILKTFEELPYTILWKYDQSDLADKPSNVIISKWVPQLEVLKHPNLKLFITHGGAQSKEEAISARVPMLGMPFLGDQPYNVKKLVTLGCALSIDYVTLEKDNFKETILEMINNPIYRERIKKLADLAEDQPMNGLDLAVWWTEYVLRHNGTTHLRSPIFDIPWYQYYLLDVAGVFLLIFVFVIYVLVVFINKLSDSVCAKMGTKALVLFVLFLIESESARILGVISTPSYSHQVWLQPFWKELSLRGHQVTVITTNPINDPALINLTEIDVSFSYKTLNDQLLKIINTESVLKVTAMSIEVLANVLDQQLEHPQVKQLITDRTVKFDLLITELGEFAQLAFATRYNCPFIAVFSTDPPNGIHKLFGNPTHPILYPDFLLGESENLSFSKRIVAVALEILLIGIEYFLFRPIEQEVARKHFNYTGNLIELSQNAGLLFMNSHPVLYGVRAINPTSIYVRGNTMRLPSKPLPKDIQMTLDKASKGFIYFSLGSNVKSKDLSNETIAIILNTFQGLSYIVLWKYELEDLPNKPNNVIISKWVPQLEVLRHKNLKLFITHGGAQSIDEAISARVPMLGMPFFVDQPYNIQKLVTRGCALSIDYRTLEQEDFKAAILEIINNPSYRNRIKVLGDLADDQPMTGLETAIWWTEYVLRHNGTNHLRSPVLDIPWYQYYFFDVAGVLILTKKTYYFNASVSANMNILLMVLLVLIKNNFGQGARILGVIPIPSYSHQVWLQPLWKELSLRGHQVTVLTTNPMNDPTLTNLTEIDTSFSYGALTDNLPEIIKTKNPIKVIGLSLRSFANAFDKQLEHPQVKKLITDESVKFDLLISEVYIHGALGFSKRFNCPAIGVVGTDPPNLVYEMAGNPTHPILNPSVLEGNEFNLINRILAVVFDNVMDWVTKYFFIPLQEDIVEKHFGVRYNLQELQEKVSVYFLNANPIFDRVRPLIPTIVQIGERPFRPTSKPLPTDIQEALDNATNGFIFFSFGSNAKVKDLSSNILNVILETFTELPYTILFKYETDYLPNKPDNVITAKWIPQLEVLKHPNIKLFINHGGYLSIQEAVAAGVPMLSLPVFADQPSSASKIVNLGCALSLDYRSLEKDTFKATILELIHNSKYRDRIKEVDGFARDLPMTGLERAIWWTEYVLRHNGTEHLRSPVLDMPFYQYYLLDVACCFLLAFIAIIFSVIFVLKSLSKLFKFITNKIIKSKID
ncbi:hypothetical protein FQR65_LT12185 [Abscondita terminalis]|nr:hypothetical protein FQR65_LT12185 [Abscondita terminalis]